MTVTRGGSTRRRPRLDLGELAEIGRHRSRPGARGSLCPGIDELEADSRTIPGGGLRHPGASPRASTSARRRSVLPSDRLLRER